MPACGDICFQFSVKACLKAGPLFEVWREGERSSEGGWGLVNTLSPAFPTQHPSRGQIFLRISLTSRFSVLIMIACFHPQLQIRNSCFSCWRNPWRLFRAIGRIKYKVFAQTRSSSRMDTLVHSLSCRTAGVRERLCVVVYFIFLGVSEGSGQLYF